MQMPAVSWLAAAMIACPVGGTPEAAADGSRRGGSWAASEAIWAWDCPVRRAGLNAEVVATIRPPTSTNGMVAPDGTLPALLRPTAAAWDALSEVVWVNDPSGPIWSE